MTSTNELNLTRGQLRLMAVLEDGHWHGLEDFLAAYIPEYRKRISELKAKGVQIESRYRTRRQKFGRYGTKYRAKDYRLVGGQR